MQVKLFSVIVKVLIVIDYKCLFVVGIHTELQFGCITDVHIPVLHPGSL